MKFKVKTPLKKDGKDYAPGKTVDLTSEEAAAIGSDVVEAVLQPVASSQADDLSKMTNADLVDFAAKSLGLKLDISVTKDDLLAAINGQKA